MLNPASVTLFSGGAPGSESAFGACAEAFGVQEVTFTFAGNESQRSRGLRLLSAEDMALRDVSVQYVSRLMGRSYPSHTDEVSFRSLLQSICWQVASGKEAFVVGEILPDDTVRGGTGWGAEFAKICNKPLFVFDQAQGEWFRWDQTRWTPARNVVITREAFTGTGTRALNDLGRQAIAQLFERSFRR
ncbi:MAG: hypothetical protein KKA55_05885 [Proteobacteria bacterium]|nr:hypothetical protein [Pseudomonadota bacterium]MBU1595050.1 hypothetical protein [Pseudomonadota bacterium]